MGKLENFVPVNRNITNHWIYDDAEYFKVWFEMLCRARFAKDSKTDTVYGCLVTINRGEFIYGRKAWSDRLHISERRLRGLIEKMIQDEMIELVQKANKFTIYRIVNYEKYNPLNEETEAEWSAPDFRQESAKNPPEFDHQTDRHNDQQEIPILSQLAILYDHHNDHQNAQQTSSKRPANDQQTSTKEKRNTVIQKNRNIYTPEFESWYSEYPRPEAKAESFKSFEKIRKDKGLDFIWICTSNYINYRNSIPEHERGPAYSSRNFFGQKAYYEDFIQPKVKDKPSSKKESTVPLGGEINEWI
jgi:hypothetical protein